MDFQDKIKWHQLKKEAAILRWQVDRQKKQGKSWIDIPEWRDWVEAEWNFLQFRNKVYEQYWKQSN